MASFYGSSPRNQRDIDMTTDVYLRDSGQQALCPPEPSNMMMYFNFQPPKYSGGSFSHMLAIANNDSGSIMNEQSATAYGDDDDENNIDAWRSGSMHNHSSSSSSIAAGSQGGGGGGLSLSLATQIPISSSSFHSDTYSIFTPPHHQSQSSEHEAHNFDSCVGLININLSINSSKFLKTAQNLLDEIVNVHTITFKQKAAGYKTHHELMTMTSLNNNTTKDNDISASKNIDGVLQSNHPDHQNSTHPPNSAAAQNIISPSEKQELQNKITQLLAMLDEVDRRYKHYSHQMQMIVSSFDTIAGCGAARPYTSLALQTISRHFRCLRDAISSQIQSARKILGEEESSSTKGCAGISRLRFIDQHLRQQRAALQQLGMMQPHAWRPQRGLPESSVSLLRAWLFEHFLHPYPNDSEKLMLARQTGLTRGQVSNWFINARVRLWKPMIEEMYKEEFGEGGEILESNSSSENTNKMKLDDHNRGSCELLDGEDGSSDQGRTDQYDDEYNSTSIGRPTTNQLLYHHGLDNLTTLMVPKDDNNNNNNNIEEIMVGAGYNNRSSSALIQDDRRRFIAPYNNNNNSTVLGLTLGLQQGEDQAMMSSPSAAHLYHSNNDDNTVQGASSLGGFGPPSHLLHDHFVASSN